MQVTNSFVTLWQGELNDHGYYKGQISDARKDKDGNYINSYYSITAGGEVAQFLASQPERTRLAIKNGRLTNETYTKRDGTKASYPSLYVFSMEDIGLADADGHAKPAQQAKPAAQAAKPKPHPQAQVDDSDDLPF